MTIIYFLIDLLHLTVTYEMNVCIANIKSTSVHYGTYYLMQYLPNHIKGTKFTVHSNLTFLFGF